MGIELTPSAAGEVRRILQGEDLKGQKLYLRVGVRSMGMRQSYILDLEESETAEDIALESQGIQIRCNRKDLLRLDGLTIDCREERGVKGFVFNLPTRRGIQRPGGCDAAQPAPGEAQVREALRQVIDPEVGANVVDLGLVYGITVTGRSVHVAMTMTTPACPLTEQIKGDAVERIFAVCPGADVVDVEIVWEPRWSPEMISAEARAQLGWSR